VKIHTVPLHIGDLLGGVSSMDAMEVGAYTLLMIACYQASDHRLPNDDGRLARMARVSAYNWRNGVRDVVMKKFRLEGDGWVNERVLQEVEKIKKLSAKNKSNSLKRFGVNYPVDNPKPIESSQKVAGRPIDHNEGNQKPETNSEDESSAVDFKKLIFNQGLKYLASATDKQVDRLRPILGKWCKVYGDAATATAIMEAQKFQAVEPVSYIEQFLKGKKHEAVKSNNNGSARPSKTDRLYEAVGRAAKSGGFAADEEPAS
jgi:uncharacterized protein YdaU (DUF1376 family)